MTRDELQTWIQYHANRFSNWYSWLTNLPSDGTVTQARTIAGWWELLRYVDLADAKRASDAMNSGELSDPKGYDRHASSIARYAKQISRRTTRKTYVDGVAAVDCATCLDMGLVEVWSPTSMHAARKGELDRTKARAIAVACDCRLGNFVAEKQDRLQFDDMSMMIFDNTDQGRAKLADFAKRAYMDPDAPVEWAPAQSYAETIASSKENNL